MPAPSATNFWERDARHGMVRCGGAARGGAVNEPIADVAEPIAHVAEPIARAAARTDRCLRPIGRESEMGPSLSEMNRL